MPRTTSTSGCCAAAPSSSTSRPARSCRPSISTSTPPSSPSIGVSAEEYAATYSQVIRIVPDDFLPWHGRTSPQSVRLAGAPAHSIDEPRRAGLEPDGEPVARLPRPARATHRRADVDPIVAARLARRAAGARSARTDRRVLRPRRRSAWPDVGQGSSSAAGPLHSAPRTSPAAPPSPRDLTDQVGAAIDDRRAVERRHRHRSRSPRPGRSSGRHEMPSAEIQAAAPVSSPPSATRPSPTATIRPSVSRVRPFVSSDVQPPLPSGRSMPMAPLGSPTKTTTSPPSTTGLPMIDPSASPGSGTGSSQAVPSALRADHAGPGRHRRRRSRSRRRPRPAAAGPRTAPIGPST